MFWQAAKGPIFIFSKTSRIALGLTKLTKRWLMRAWSTKVKLGKENVELFYYSSIHLNGAHTFNFTFLPCHHNYPILRRRSVLFNVVLQIFHFIGKGMLAAWRLQTAKAVKVLFHPLLHDGPRDIDFWKILKFRQSVLLIRMTCRLRRVWSIVEMAFIEENVGTWRKTFLSTNFSTTDLTWTHTKYRTLASLVRGWRLAAFFYLFFTDTIQ